MNKSVTSFLLTLLSLSALAQTDLQVDTFTTVDGDTSYIQYHEVQFKTKLQNIGYQDIPIGDTITIAYMQEEDFLFNANYVLDATLFAGDTLSILSPNFTLIDTGYQTYCSYIVYADDTTLSNDTGCIQIYAEPNLSTYNPSQSNGVRIYQSNERLIVDFETPLIAKTTFVVYDLTGRVVMNRTIPEGVTYTSFPLNKFSTSALITRLIQSNQILDTRKIGLKK